MLLTLGTPASSPFTRGLEKLLGRLGEGVAAQVNTDR
jgi:hypothetical protein